MGLLFDTWIQPAVFCYIDPGTGSIILQAIVGGIAAGLVAVRLFRHRILRFFGVKQKPLEEEKD